SNKLTEVVSMICASVAAVNPFFQFSGRTKQPNASALEFEGCVLNGDVAFTGLRTRIAKVFDGGVAGVYTRLDGIEIRLRDFVFELRDFLRSLKLANGTL